MFRKQEYDPIGASAPVVPVFKSDDDGNVIEDKFITNKALPPVENYRLDSLIKAGVDLKQVDTRVLGDSVSFEAVSEPENENEAEENNDEV